LVPNFHGTRTAIGAPKSLRKHLAIGAQGHQRERMHRLVHAQAFHVRPVDVGDLALPRNCFGIEEAGEFHVLRVRGGLDALQDLGERIADVGNDVQPALGAEHAVDALFERGQGEQVFEVEHRGLAQAPSTVTFHGYGVYASPFFAMSSFELAKAACASWRSRSAWGTRR
jgi:hypothetical protein